MVLAVARASDRSLVAFVLPETVDAAELQAALKRQLPSYMVPDAVLTRSHFPLTANGKIDRDKLANSWDIHVPGKRDAHRREPGTEMEQHVLDCFREALGLQSSTHLGVDDDFFESLICFQLGRC